MVTSENSTPELRAELADLRARLAEAEETLRAIRAGEAEALVIAGNQGDEVHLLGAGDRIYRQFIETASEGTATVSAAGEILSCNDSLANTLRRPLDRVFGTAMRDHVSPHDHEAFRAILAQTGPESSRLKIRLITSAGTLVPVYLSATLLHSAGADPVYCLVLTDLEEVVSAEQQVHWEQDRAQTYLDTVETIIVAMDSKGCIVSVNRKGCEILGWSEQELLGRLWFSACLPQPDGMEKVYPQFLRLMAGELETMLYFENPIVTKSGELRQIAWHNAVLRDDQGRISGTLSSGDDITERKRTEDALRASQQLIEGIINAITVRVFWKDRNLVYLGCNAAFARDAGFADPRDLIGKDDFQMGWKDQADLYRADDRQVMERGVTKLLIEEPSTTPDGKSITLLTSKLPLRNSQGGVSGVIGTYIDITERKLAEQTTERYNQELLELADASSVILASAGASVPHLFKTICDIIARKFSLKMVGLGLVVKDSHDVNFLAQSGLDDGFMQSMKIAWDDSPAGMGPTGMAIKTKAVQVVDNVRTDNRVALWREEALSRGLRSMLAAPMVTSEGLVIGTLNLYRDDVDYFTPQHQRIFQILANQAATAIESARVLEGLELKVAERTREYETANRQLLTMNDELALRRSEAEAAKLQADAANRAKSDFLANMSHELRTPLNAIIGFSDVMINGMSGPMTDEQIEFLGDIGTSGKHLLSLINDILDLSKVEAGKMQLEPGTLNVEELLENSLEMFREKALRSRIKVDHRVDDGIADIIADKMKLKQILMNLLSNAFKYTPEGGAITLRAWREGRGEIGFSVADTGPGIGAEDVPKLFRPFQQLGTSLSQKAPGTGLGLNLCKKFVELHGGRIWVESEVGNGSRFIFTISPPAQ